MKFVQNINNLYIKYFSIYNNRFESFIYKKICVYNMSKFMSNGRILTEFIHVSLNIVTISIHNIKIRFLII